MVFSGAYSQSGTGIGTTVPNSTLDVRGGMALAIRTVSSSTTLTITDHIIVFTGTSNATATLPDATTCKGRIYWIKNASPSVPASVLTVNTSASQLIDGAPGSNLEEPNEILRVISDGSNWVISTQSVPTAKSTTTGGSWNQGGNILKAMKALGTSTNFDFPVITNNAEAVRVTSNGYLGIGTNNPQGRIHIANDNDDAGNDYTFSDYLNGTSITQGFLEKKSSGTFASPGNLALDDLIGQFRFAPRNGGSLVRNSGSGWDAVYKGDGTTALTDLRMLSSNAERMRINETGNIAIGTSSFTSAAPEKLLVDAGSTGSYNVISGKGEIDNYLQLNIQNKSGGNVASSDLVATADNGDENVNYIDLGINSSGYSAGTAPILNSPVQTYLFATGADFVIGNSTPSQDLIFFNAGTLGYAATSERMRVTSSGNVGIGQIISPSEKLIVGGILSPATDNAFTFGTSDNRWSAVWAANGAVQTSDMHLKTNITNLNYGIREVMRLRPVHYNWKTDPHGPVKVGLIAQETQKLIPEVVTGKASKQKLGMNYPEMVSVLISAIQQQQEKIKQLKAELASLNRQ